MSDHAGFKTARDRAGGVVGATGQAGICARWWWSLLAVGAFWAGGPAHAETNVSCGGFAMLGGAQIVCSHVRPQAPTQFCTFSWALLTTDGAVSISQGSFLLPAGASELTVYQGAGFASALSEPIVLCQGKKSR